MTRRRAVVTGMIASYPVGGVAWDYGQYALGLERLGFEVFYLEDTGWQTYDPTLGRYGEDCSYAVSFLADALAVLSPTLATRWCFRNSVGQRFGPAADDIGAIVAKADLFLNVSGGTLLRDDYMGCRHKILVDTDPGWNHFRNYPTRDALDALMQGHRDTARSLLERTGNFDYAADLDGWLARSAAWRAHRPRRLQLAVPRSGLAADPAPGGPRLLASARRGPRLDDCDDLEEFSAANGVQWHPVWY